MQHEDSYEDDWREEAPLLAALGKDAEPAAPKGYFEGLPASVLSRIRNLPVEADEPVLELNSRAETLDSRPVRTVTFRRTMVWGMAAGIALLVGFGTYFLTRPGTTEGTLLAEEVIRKETLVQLASLDSREITPYLDVTEVSDEQLFEALGSEGEAAFEAENHAVQQDEAAEYLQDVNLDEIDWQDLDIDLEDLQ